jgi:ribosomal protein S8E
LEEKQTERPHTTLTHSLQAANLTRKRKGGKKKSGEEGRNEKTKRKTKMDDRTQWRRAGKRGLAKTLAEIEMKMMEERFRTSQRTLRRVRFDCSVFLFSLLRMGRDD